MKAKTPQLTPTQKVQILDGIKPHAKPLSIQQQQTLISAYLRKVNLAGSVTLDYVEHQARVGEPR